MTIRPILPTNSGLSHQAELIKAWELHDQVNARRDLETSPSSLPPQPDSSRPQKAISNSRWGTEAYLAHFGASKLPAYLKRRPQPGQNPRAFRRVALGVPVLETTQQGNGKNSDSSFDAGSGQADTRIAAVLLTTALPGGRRQASQQRGSALLKLRNRNGRGA